MKEVLLKHQEVGFLLQPAKPHTQVAHDIVGEGTTIGTWENVQTNTAVFFPFRAYGDVIYNPNTSVTTLDEMSSTTIFAETDRTKVNSKSVLPTMDLTVYATPQSAVALFLTALQKGTQYTVTSPYKKIIVPNDEEVGFKGITDTGFLLSVASMGYNGGAGASDGVILQNAIVNSLTMSLVNRPGGDASQNLMKFDIKLIGQKLLENQYVTFGAKPSYIYNSVDDITDVFKVDFRFDNDALVSGACWREFSLTINNNITSDCIGIDGYANNLKRVNPEITYTLKLPHNSDTFRYLSKFSSGAGLFIDLHNGKTVADNNYFRLLIANSVITAPIKATEGDYIAQQIQGRVLRKAGVGWDEFLTITDSDVWTDTNLNDVAA